MAALTGSGGWLQTEWVAAFTGIRSSREENNEKPRLWWAGKNRIQGRSISKHSEATPMLLKTVVSGKIKPEQLVTHHFELAEISRACEVFGNAEKEKALKIILKN